MRIYIYILHELTFEGVCLTTVILAPGAREKGVGGCGPSRPSRRDGRSAGNFREVIFSAQAAYLKGICSELDVQFCPKTTKPSSPNQGDLHGMSRRLKEGIEGCPKGPKRSTKSARRAPEVEQQITKLFIRNQNIRKLPIHRHTAAG